MGDDSRAWFGFISSIASAVGSVIESKKCYGLGMHTKRRLGGILMEMGGDGEKKGDKVGTNHIQQSTKAGGGAGRQWGGGADEMEGDKDR